MKMAYAAWSKGTAAMLLAIRDVAAHYGVEDEWRCRRRRSWPSGCRGPSGSAAKKGWRWIGEMEEIADTFAAAGAAGGVPSRRGQVYRA